MRKKQIAIIVLLAVALIIIFTVLIGCGETTGVTESGPGVEDARKSDTGPSSPNPPAEETVRVFFMKGEAPFEVTREVKVAGVESALYELLKGPTPDEESEGLATVIPEGTRVRSCSVDEGVARVDFSEEIRNYGGGSAMVQAITSQITRTVMANDSSVTSVSITVQGIPAEEALQP